MKKKWYTANQLLIAQVHTIKCYIISVSLKQCMLIVPFDFVNLIAFPKIFMSTRSIFSGSMNISGMVFKFTSIFIFLTQANPFKEPHYLIVNFAIGGTNGGDPADTPFPSLYEIEYVRVYQKTK